MGGKWGLRVDLTCRHCQQLFQLRPGEVKRGRTYCSIACRYAGSKGKARKHRRRHIPLTVERLKQLLSYDPETGIFVWLVTRARAVMGDEAGIVTSHGYRSIGVDGHPYYAHRLAWFYMTGAWPDRIVDHRDMDGLNNRFDNLRLATKGQNGTNSRARSDNKSGLKGAYWSEERQCWYSTLRIDGKSTSLGTFASAEDAAAAFSRATARVNGEFGRGESAPC